MQETKPNIPKQIFNMEEADPTDMNLFLGNPPGLFDTINRRHPEIWDLYKEMKSLDWDEHEFPMTSCNTDFKTCDKSTYDIMIKTLAWQWEADSIAARSIAGVMAPVITSDDLWAAWQRISDNEVLHAAQYSEIVRNSFDDPSIIKAEILKIDQSLSRMETVAKVFADVHDTAHKYALGMVPNDQDTYNKIFMFPIAMFLMERLQFLASFAVTFTIADTGVFQPIGKAVQKIAQDEIEVHVELDKAVILNERKTPRGQIAWQQMKPVIQKMADEVLMRELSFPDYLFSEGRQLVGMTADYLKNWVKFCGFGVYEFLELEPPVPLIKKNPMKHMETWLDISKTQPAPQEEAHGQYKVGIISRDDEDAVFDTDF